MAFTQKVVLIALLALGGLCLIVGLTLTHYVGGFLHTVEEEAREEDEAARAATSENASESDNNT